MPVDMIILYNPPADPAAFDRHYRETHAPLVDAMPHLVAFEYSEGAVAVVDGGPFHLVARLRFASAADKDASLASPEGVRALEDLANFSFTGATVVTATMADR
jgi:uncharacterized protein (TIGR02118 family)